MNNVAIDMIYTQDFITGICFLITSLLTRLTPNQSVSPTPRLGSPSLSASTKTSFPTDRRIHAGTSVASLPPTSYIEKLSQLNNTLRHTRYCTYYSFLLYCYHLPIAPHLTHRPPTGCESRQHWIPHLGTSQSCAWGYMRAGEYISSGLLQH